MARALLNGQSGAVEPRVHDQDLRHQFGDPIYVIAHVDYDNGWASSGRTQDHRHEVTSVSIRHNYGDSSEVRVTTWSERPGTNRQLIQLLLHAQLVFPLTITEETVTLKLGREAVSAQALRLSEEQWIATAVAGSRWVEVQSRGVRVEGLELTVLI